MIFGFRSIQSLVTIVLQQTAVGVESCSLVRMNLSVAGCIMKRSSSLFYDRWFLASTFLGMDATLVDCWKSVQRVLLMTVSIKLRSRNTWQGRIAGVDAMSALSSI